MRGRNTGRASSGDTRNFSHLRGLDCLERGEFLEPGWEADPRRRDDPLIALDLKVTLEAAGVVVLGPVMELARAMLLVEPSQIDAAVLDVRLEVGTTMPLASWLAARGIPFLFQTSDPTVIDAAHSTVPILRKPFRGEQLIAALAALLAGER